MRWVPPYAVAQFVRCQFVPARFSDSVAAGQKCRAGRGRPASGHQARLIERGSA